MIYIDRNTINTLGYNALRKHKKNTLFLSILLFLCGVLCLILPLYAGVALSYLAGTLFAICGIFSITYSFAFIKKSKGSFFSLFLFGIVYIILGFSFVVSPVMGIYYLAIMIAILFVFGGVNRIMAAFKNKNMVGRYWCMFIGLLDLVIAFFWMDMNVYTTYILTTTFIGLEMLFNAWVLFTLRYKFDSLKGVYSGT